MKKQSGFTLIELMVVMAIIAILATAGLAAYTGYIKKARDSKRIADLQAISTIVSTKMGTTGLPPTTAGAVTTAISEANNGQALVDPAAGKTTCIGSITCNYQYTLCDGGTGFAIRAGFESTANADKLVNDPIGTVAAVSGGNAASASDNYYSVGSCKTYCASSGACSSGSWVYTNI